MSQDKWSGLKFNTKENYEKFNSMLKSKDEEYRTTNIKKSFYLFKRVQYNYFRK